MYYCDVEVEYQNGAHEIISNDEPCFLFMYDDNCYAYEAMLRARYITYYPVVGYSPLEGANERFLSMFNALFRTEYSMLELRTQGITFNLDYTPITKIYYGFKLLRAMTEQRNALRFIPDKSGEILSLGCFLFGMFLRSTPPYYKWQNVPAIGNDDMLLSHNFTEFASSNMVEVYSKIFTQRDLSGPTFKEVDQDEISMLEHLNNSVHGEGVERTNYGHAIHHKLSIPWDSIWTPHTVEKYVNDNLI